MESVFNFFKCEEGLTIVEYVLGAALLLVALSGFFSLYASSLSGSLATTVDKASGA